MKPPITLPILWLAALSVSSHADTVQQVRAMVVQATSITDVAMYTVANGLVGDEATRAYSGEFQVIFSFDRETLEVESFQFNGGDVRTSGYVLEFTGFVTYPPPYNQQFTYVLRQPNSAPTYMRFSPETRAGKDGTLNPDGTLINTDYFLYTDLGNQFTARAVTGTSQPPVLIDYAVTPASLLFKGVATPWIDSVSSSLYEQTLQAYLTIELDESDIVTLPGSVPKLNLDVLETESGTVTAKTFQFTIPTAYGQWADDNELDEPDPEDTNEAGIPYAILFALDLPADASTLPITTEIREGGPVAVLTLPEGGLNNPMTAEYSPDLSAGSFAELDPSYYLDGADSLDLGATGDPAFAYPAGNGGFIRFATAVE